MRGLLILKRNVSVKIYFNTDIQISPLLPQVLTKNSSNLNANIRDLKALRNSDLTRQPFYYVNRPKFYVNGN